MKTSEATKAKKVTLATIKAFIRKNEGRLWICNYSDFDGTTDCVTGCADHSFRRATSSNKHQSNTLGIDGVWVVGGSRNSFYRYDADGFQGISVYNCCGSFAIAIKN